ncbi:hypothetical protein VCHA53O466_140072 [Vibrio chagasii]|nr:hypothetical protein VCHA53O466_140072 [Vibrio chagasii]
MKLVFILILSLAAATQLGVLMASVVIETHSELSAQIIESLESSKAQ